MIIDPIVEEVRRARAEYAGRFNYDLRAMCEDLRKLSEKTGVATVTRSARPVPTRPEPVKNVG